MFSLHGSQVFLEDFSLSVIFPITWSWMMQKVLCDYRT
jgi:hypothetical protein